jgi:phosphoketolase
MIVLRSPKGWSAPKEVAGHKLEGSWRAHQVPLPDVKKNPESCGCWKTGCARSIPIGYSTRAAA